MSNSVACQLLQSMAELKAEQIEVVRDLHAKVQSLESSMINHITQLEQEQSQIETLQMELNCP